MPEKEYPMKRLALAVGLASPFTFCASSQGRPPYPALFMEEYKANPDIIKAAKEAKCNVCHDAAGKSKKDRNEYGKALGQHVTGADFKMLMANKAALAAKVSVALKATEAEKNAAGKTYGDIIKGGKLPAP
jgi:hypothetical protein